MLPCGLRNFLQVGMQPNAFTKSLTYEEQLIEMYKTICEIIKTLDQIDITKIQELIDQEIEKLKQYVDIEDQNLYNTIIDYYNKGNQYTDLEIAKSSESLIKLMQSYDLQLKNEILVLLQDLQNQIDDIIIDGIKILNPTNGKVEDIEKVINDVYDKLRYLGISAIEYDVLNLSADDYDALLLSATDYDVYAKWILQKEEFNQYMFSPFTGEKEKYSTVINELAELHKQDLTALEYDNLDLTAQEFDDKNLTAGDFDWNGKNLLSA